MKTSERQTFNKHWIHRSFLILNKIQGCIIFSSKQKYLEYFRNFHKQMHIVSSSELSVKLVRMKFPDISQTKFLKHSNLQPISRRSRLFQIFLNFQTILSDVPNPADITFLSTFLQKKMVLLHQNFDLVQVSSYLGSVLSNSPFLMPVRFRLLINYSFRSF